MATRNRLTAVRGERAWGAGWKKVKALTKTHIYITHRHGHQCGDSQRGRGVGAGAGGKGRKIGTEGDFAGGKGTRCSLRIEFDCVACLTPVWAHVPRSPIHFKYTLISSYLVQTSFFIRGMKNSSFISVTLLFSWIDYMWNEMISYDTRHWENIY